MKIKQNIAYHCATKELEEQFLKDAEEQGIDIHFFKQNHIVGNDYTYRIDEDNNLFVSDGLFEVHSHIGCEWHNSKFFKTYQEAIDYARKLFLGEEDESKN